MGVENYYILEQKDFDNGIDFTNIKRIENELDHKIENYWKSVLKIVNKLFKFEKCSVKASLTD